MFDEYVRLEQRVADYRTEITGMTPESLQGKDTLSVEEIQVHYILYFFWKCHEICSSILHLVKIL